jgi:hypothetical protein
MDAVTMNVSVELCTVCRKTSKSEWGRESIGVLNVDRRCECIVCVNPDQPKVLFNLDWATTEGSSCFLGLLLFWLQVFQMNSSQSIENWEVSLKKNITFGDFLKYSRWKSAWNLGQFDIFSNTCPTLDKMYMPHISSIVIRGLFLMKDVTLYFKIGVEFVDQPLYVLGFTSKF